VSGGQQRRGAFVDSARITARAGHGGRGASSFRSQPFEPNGGPDGGDGGRGGSIVAYATTEASSLAQYARRPLWQAAGGAPGKRTLKHGGDGPDERLPVPVGTLILDDLTGELVADLDRPGLEAVVARGGLGGRGNVHFKSSVNRSPNFAEPGRPGEERVLRLELKLIADAGLVGPPNAGKSSLLRAISAATPRVASYPFTTLDPELGVSELATGARIVVADIPGLIEGAAGGKGLGFKFLRHIARTRLLIHCISLESDNPRADYDTVRAELDKFENGVLTQKPEVIILTKSDTREAEDLQRISAEFSELGNKIHTVTILDDASLKQLQDFLMGELRALKS